MSFLISLTLAAGEFSDATPITNFLDEMESHVAIPSSRTIAPKLILYSYNAPSSAAHTWVLYWAPPGNPAASRRIPLEMPTQPGTFFASPCDKEGIVVPRIFGFIATAQPPAPADYLANGNPFELYFSTTGKTAAGTLTIEYEWGPTSG